MSKIEEEGYYVVKGLLTAEEVKVCKKEIKEIMWYEKFERTGVEGKDWEEPVNRMPAINNDSRLMSEDKELSVRPLLIDVNNEFFYKLCRHPKFITEDMVSRHRSLQADSL